jgi:hypothetical protein
VKNGYNRAAAVDYARKWAMARNPRFFDFSTMGGDCTNFVSQCLLAGGLKMSYGDYGWYYINVHRRSASFSGVQYLYNYLTNPRAPIATETAPENLSAGDIVQLSFDGVVFGHSLFVTTAGADPLVATHTMDCIDRPLSTYSYLTARGLHIG